MIGTQTKGGQTMTRAEMVTRWIDYCGQKTSDWNICKAGIGILNKDNADYYGEVGLNALFQAACAEVHGPEDHPAWPCGVKPTRY